ncbi:MAG TPA: molecular chaperone TorD family protein [Holophagaceae bacterium]|nr:molecular chaperone TorD family protein [Holophagaceae bacterium]
MKTSLPVLLEALAALFAEPGTQPSRAFRDAAEAGWPGPKLTESLLRLAAADTAELDVAYADHFLYSSWEPVLHLEASVFRQGLLCDEALLARRASLHARMGAHPPEGRCPDHLASGLQVLAAALAGLGRTGLDPDRLSALRTFVTEHLGPQVSALRELGQTRPLHPVFEAALEVAQELLAELAPALAEP